jgi:hypothetical protein
MRIICPKPVSRCHQILRRRPYIRKGGLFSRIVYYHLLAVLFGNSIASVLSNFTYFPDREGEVHDVAGTIVSLLLIALDKTSDTAVEQLAIVAIDEVGRSLTPATVGPSPSPSV